LPLQVRETGEIAVVRDPFAAPLARECGEPGIGDARSSRVSLDAQSFEDLPMTLARLHDLAIWVRKEIIAKPERFRRSARGQIDARVGSDPNHGAEGKWGQTESSIAGQNRHQPRTANRVPRRIRPKSINQGIYVRQDHSKGFMRSTYSRSSASSSEDEASKSTPGITPPLASLTGGSLCVDGLGRLFPTITRLRPSSISAVSVRPSAAALRLARRKSSSGSRTVVPSLTCLTCALPMVCQYVIGLRLICGPTTPPAPRSRRRQCRRGETSCGMR
jgi:hypothetical protein